MDEPGNVMMAKNEWLADQVMTVVGTSLFTAFYNPIVIGATFYFGNESRLKIRDNRMLIRKNRLILRKARYEKIFGG